MGITGKSLYTRCCFLLIIMPIKLLIKLVCANMLLDKFQLRRCLICSFLMSGMPVSCVGIFPGLESPKRSVHPVTCPPPTSSLTSSTLCICSPSMTNGTWSAIQLWGNCKLKASNCHLECEPLQKKLFSIYHEVLAFTSVRFSNNRWPMIAIWKSFPAEPRQTRRHLRQ